MKLPKTAFGQVAVAEETIVAAWTFAYNVNTDMVSTTTANGGSVTHSGEFAVLNTSAAANGSAKIATKLPLRYITGQGAVARFTAVFTQGVAGSTQIIGVGNDNDGLFFGFNGTSFGSMLRRDGTDTWTPSSDWFGYEWSWGDDAPDPTKGNVYQIRFQWLGFGELQFWIEDPDTGGFVLAHRIQYANANTSTSMLNPTFPIMAEVKNTTNDTAIILKTPSAAGFVEGKIENPAPPHPFALNRTRVAADTGITTENNILTLKNQATWQTIDNQVRAQPRMLSVAVDGTKTVVIRLTKNTTLGGTPSYTDHSANTSPIQFDTAGTTLTGGTVVFAATLDKTGSAIYDLDKWGIRLDPGEILTVSAESAAAADVDIALSWVDLF